MTKADRTLLAVALVLVTMWSLATLGWWIFRPAQERLADFLATDLSGISHDPHGADLGDPDTPRRHASSG